jgi:hypothetical protein
MLSVDLNTRFRRIQTSGCSHSQYYKTEALCKSEFLPRNNDTDLKNDFRFLLDRYPTSVDNV